MSEQPNPKNEEIEQFIRANFGDREVQEVVLLVRKEQHNIFIQTLKGSGLTVVAMLSKMTEHNVKQLEKMGESIDNYWQIHVLILPEQTPLLFKVLQHSGMSGVSSDKAKAIVDFYTKDGSGENIQ